LVWIVHIRAGMRSLTIAAAITLLVLPAAVQAEGKGRASARLDRTGQQAAFNKGHAMIMRSPFYKPTRGDRIKRALRPLTLPKARRWLKQQGRAVRKGLTNNRLTRLPATARARRRARVGRAIVGALRKARTPGERGAFSIGRVVSLQAVGGGVYDAKVSFLSKRSGGKTERMVRLKLHNGPLGLGKLLGRAPRVSVVGLRPGVSLSTLAPLAGNESVIVGQKTMLGIQGVAR